MGRLDEQREAPGGGNHTGGAGVQLEDGSGQFSLFGGVDYKPLAHTPRPGGEVITLRIQVPQAAIDEALRVGANDPSSRLRIPAEFMKDKSLEENVRFLQRHYGENGAGFYVGERKYALQEPDSLQRIVDEFGAFLSAYAHDRGLLWFHYHRTDEIMQSLKDLHARGTGYQFGSLTYNGEVQKSVWNGFDPAAMLISDIQEAADAGTYEVIFSPNRTTTGRITGATKAGAAFG